jgi:hypothetical protein
MHLNVYYITHFVNFKKKGLAVSTNPEGLRLI